MVDCLNPHLWPGAHDNADDAIICKRCGFLIQGARFGGYQVDSLVGQGTYGHVYKVRETTPLGRTLALKLLRIEQITDKALKDFFEEAQLIASFMHPYILPIYNFDQLPDPDRRPYFVMDLAPCTLEKLFRNPDGSKRIALVEELVDYLQQIAEVLYYVHDKKERIHQDIKPGNFLIGLDGKIRLSDFGTALFLGSYTHASLDPEEIIGTAHYMPCEQWKAHPRRESDQYALAITCYQLLTGRVPFKEYKTNEALMTAHCNVPPPPPRQWNARIPDEVEAVLLRAMSKNYQQRYSSVKEFYANYRVAVEFAQKRYLCHKCNYQNRFGAKRCSKCGSEESGRLCSHCDTALRIGKRFCRGCSRLSISPTMLSDSSLEGTSVSRGRYIIKHILNENRLSGVMITVAYDTLSNGEKVVLKRWECTNLPLENRINDQKYYEKVTEPLVRFHHPFVPRILDRFVEGKYYYIVFQYIEGESLEERLQKWLKPLPEREVLDYMYVLINILIALEREHSSLRHYDISPANIIIENTRGKAVLTGFQVENIKQNLKDTKRVSPYLAPDLPGYYDHRTSIYMLAASMHHTLTNYAPTGLSDFLPVRGLNPTLSPKMEAILSRALMKDSAQRYQTYEEMQSDIQILRQSLK